MAAFFSRFTFLIAGVSFVAIFALLPNLVSLVRKNRTTLHAIILVAGSTLWLIAWTALQILRIAIVAYHLGFIALDLALFFSIQIVTQITSTLYWSIAGAFSDKAPALLLRKMDEASSYEQWVAAALEYDEATGGSEWRQQDNSMEGLCDISEMKQHAECLREARETRNIARLMFLLKTSNTRDAFNLCNAQLFGTGCRVGTIHAVESYFDEVDRCFVMLALAGLEAKRRERNPAFGCCSDDMDTPASMSHRDVPAADELRIILGSEDCVTAAPDFQDLTATLELPRHALSLPVPASVRMVEKGVQTSRQLRFHEAKDEAEGRRARELKLSPTAMNLPAQTPTSCVLDKSRLPMRICHHGAHPSFEVCRSVDGAAPDPSLERASTDSDDFEISEAASSHSNDSNPREDSIPRIIPKCGPDVRLLMEKIQHQAEKSLAPWECLERDIKKVQRTGSSSEPKLPEAVPPFEIESWDGVWLPSFEAIERFFSYLRLSVGRTALCLSGGGALAMYHVGVVKALAEQGLLPRVISGASGGSIVAGHLAMYDDESLLKEVLKPDIPNRYGVRWFPPLMEQLKNLLVRGQLLNEASFENTCRTYFGDITLGEAYSRTGRLVCIVIAPASRLGEPLMLNCISTPDVLLWSAVCVSCSLPGLMKPQVLFAKDSDGQAVPYFSFGMKWMDGSLRMDIPRKELSAFFNAKHFVVSQVNPHHAPFVSARVWDSKLYKVLGTWLTMDLKVRYAKLVKLGMMPKIFGQDISTFWMLQNFEGNVTITPGARLLDWYRIINNPTEEDMKDFILSGQQRTWPHVSRLTHSLRFEKTLRNAWATLHRDEVVPCR